MEIGDKVLVTKSYFNVNIQECTLYKEYEGIIIAETENKWKIKKNWLCSEWILKTGTFDKVKKIKF